MISYILKDKIEASYKALRVAAEMLRTTQK